MKFGNIAFFHKMHSIGLNFKQNYNYLVFINNFCLKLYISYLKSQNFINNQARM